MKRHFLTCVLTSGLAAAGSTHAELLDLSKKPLFLSAGVAPNVVVTIDESASMRSAWMPEKYDDNCGWRKPLFYAAAVNTIYFNPNITYAPPMKADGTSMPNSNFHSAPMDGFFPSSSVDLAKDYYPTVSMETGAINHFRVTYSANPPTCDNQPGSAPSASGLQTALPLAVQDSSTGKVTSPAFYYVFNGDPSNSAQVADTLRYTLKPISAAQEQNFANWYTYYRTRMLLARSALSTPFATSSETLRVAWQNLAKPAGTNLNVVINPATTMLLPFKGASKNSFFSWLFGFRSAGQTPTREAMYRAGELFSRPLGAANDPYYDAASGKELSCRQNYHILVTDGGWNDTVLFDNAFPGAGDVDHVDHVLPDGTAYSKDNLESRIYGAEVAMPTYATGTDRTLADIAWHYWASDLRTDIPDEVPRRWADYTTGVTSNAPQPTNAAQALATRETYFNPKNDPANWQHMVNYIVGLGVAGKLAFPDDYVSLRKGPKVWPKVGYTPIGGTSEGVDDTWHASINSRGDYLSATNPSDLQQALSLILMSIDRQRGSAAATSFSTSVLGDGATAYRGGYDTTDWSGFLEAHAVTAAGVSDAVIWDAGKVLGTVPPDDRVIITSASAAGSGIPFRWSALPSDYRAALDDNPATVAVDSDGQGSMRLDYLRGDRSHEVSSGGSFRTRNVLLGPIVNSSPIVVAGVAGGYDDEKFPAGSAEAIAAANGVGFSWFRTQYKERARTVIVGANDGMLHAFDAGQGASDHQTESVGTGKERWAYVPHRAASRLSLLTSPHAAFEPFVDNTPMVRDVFVKGAWRTVLVGTMRRGGQAAFALDVTETNQTEAVANQFVLWEFSDELNDGGLLGYTYGKANIARLADGHWAALVPGGYNNEEPDGHAGDGSAALFVVDLESGALLRKFTLPGTYGLSFATTGDYEGDYVDDFAVAGDMQGNVWRFDFSGSNPAAWKVEPLFKAEHAGDQPITSAPRIFSDGDTGDLMIVFGTGRMLTSSDVLSANTQSFYALREHAAHVVGGVTRSELVDQKLAQVNAAGHTYFTVTPMPLQASDKGWRIDFVGPGERVINAPGALFTEGVVMIETVTPNGGDPCKGGFRGGLYLLSAANGAPPSGGPYFDTNGDGTIGQGDNANAVGIPVDQGLAEGTAPLMILPGGGLGSIPEYSANAPAAPWRRVNWKDLSR